MKKALFIVGALVFLALGAVTAFAPPQAQVACMPVKALVTDADVIAENLRYPLTRPLQVNHLQGCTSSDSVEQAKASVDTQIRAGSVLVTDGQYATTQGIPPARIVTYDYGK